MRRIEQVNELLKNKLAILISREVPLENGLITITYVDCAPNLSSAKIGISVLPFNSSKNVIEKLKKHGSLFASILKKETRLRRIPKFDWVIDEAAEGSSEIEEVFRKIHEEEK